MKVRIGDYVKYKSSSGYVYHGRINDVIDFGENCNVYAIHNLYNCVYIGQDEIVRVYKDRYKKPKKG